VEQAEFVAEGHLVVGPKEQFFLFLDGEHLGQLLLKHFGLPERRGDTNLGRVRVTVERLEEQ
jgi:hypothetical protein